MAKTKNIKVRDLKPTKDAKGGGVTRNTHGLESHGLNTHGTNTHGTNTHGTNTHGTNTHHHQGGSGGHH
jgi:hypothetical protein